MSKIPSITIEHEGVVYAAEWRDDGTINYKGVDKDGNEVSATPEVVMSMARSYGEGYAKSNASGDAKPEDQKENPEKDVNHFEIDTDGKGGWTLKKGDKSKLSSKQLEWCENMAKNAIGKSEVMKGFNPIGKGIAQEVDLKKTPVQLVQDIAKFGKEIAQGHFKEATGKAAEKISENLKAMIGLGRPDESKLYGITKFINQVYVKPIKQGVDVVKQQTGKAIGNIVKRLRGGGR